MFGRAAWFSLASVVAVLPGCVTRRCGPCDARCAAVEPSPTTTSTVAAGESPEAAAARRGKSIALMDEARARKAYLPLKSEEEARASMPSMDGFPVVPNLIRIAAARPKTMEAEMAAWDALKAEGTVDRRLLGELFWVVSRSNECGHCMGHIVFGTSLKQIPLEKVLDFDADAGLDPRRRATFAFARKVSRDPHSVGPADVESLRPYFKDDQIVEIILAVCRYKTMNTLAEAFGSPLETINVFDKKNAKPKPPPVADAPADPKPDPKADAGPAAPATPESPSTR